MHVRRRTMPLGLFFGCTLTIGEAAGLRGGLLGDTPKRNRGTNDHRTAELAKF